MSRTVSPTQDQTTKTRTYFKSEHEGSLLSSVYFIRTKAPPGGVKVCYDLRNGILCQATPRAQCKWLDPHDDAFVKQELAMWRKRINGDRELDPLEPQFFLKQRQDFVHWLQKTAKLATIQEHLRNLTHHVFPYFVGLRKQPEPARWVKLYSDFYTFLENSGNSVQTRNHIRTATNRYLVYLREKHNAHGAVLLPMEQIRRSTQEPVAFPSQRLPSYPELDSWYRTVSLPLRERWTLLLMLAFGVRFSEALAATPSDLLGEGDAENIKSSSDVVSAILKAYSPTAFLQITKAVKRPLKHKAVIHLAGALDDTPKSGDYVAACFSTEFSAHLEAFAEEWDLKPATQQDYIVAYNRILKAVDATSSSSDLAFNEYHPHDFRRLSVTMKVMSMQNTYYTSRIHGHGEEVSKGYLQKGLELQKRTTKVVFKAIGKKTA